MTANTIDLSLNSYARFDDAMAMCDLLARETGADYTVMADDHLGFTAKRHQDNRQKQEQEPIKTVTRHESDHRQAFRGFISHYLEIAAGLMLITSPYRILEWLFTLLGIQTIPEWINVPGLCHALSYGGYLLGLYGLRFIYSYFAIKLCIGQDSAVLKKGIISREQIQIRFVDIKAMSINQSIIGRLLGIGTLRLDSAGTNGKVDIVFNNLINPVVMRHRIQHLIDQQVKK